MQCYGNKNAKFCKSCNSKTCKCTCKMCNRLFSDHKRSGYFICHMCKRDTFTDKKCLNLHFETICKKSFWFKNCNKNF